MRRIKAILAYVFQLAGTITIAASLALSQVFLNPAPIIFLIIPAMIFYDIGEKIENSL